MTGGIWPEDRLGSADPLTQVDLAGPKSKRVKIHTLHLHVPLADLAPLEDDLQSFTNLGHTKPFDAPPLMPDLPGMR